MLFSLKSQELEKSMGFINNGDMSMKGYQMFFK